MTSSVWGGEKPSWGQVLIGTKMDFVQIQSNKKDFFTKAMSLNSPSGLATISIFSKSIYSTVVLFKLTYEYDVLIVLPLFFENFDPKL